MRAQVLKFFSRVSSCLLSGPEVPGSRTGGKRRGRNATLSIGTGKREKEGSEAEVEEKKKKKDSSLTSSSSSFSRPFCASQRHSATMSLSATLKRYATPTNVQSAAGWGGTAAVAALFLVQVRFFLSLQSSIGHLFASRAAAALVPLDLSTSTPTSSISLLQKTHNSTTTALRLYQADPLRLERGDEIDVVIRDGVLVL